ncbi:hypothetical protein BHM03_00052505, partial [Ensete ventricosum]
ALFTSWKMRRRLVFLRWDEALLHSSYAVTRWHLVLPLEDEVSPHLPSLGRGIASSSSARMRRCLILLGLGRGAASFFYF